MDTLTQKPDTTLTEPRDISGFLDAIGITQSELELIAVETGWQVRTPRKIPSAHLLAALCGNVSSALPSYNRIASSIDDSTEGDPTKQAVAGRMNQSCLEMVETVLRIAIGKRVAASVTEGERGLFGKYQRVLVQDSTVIRLPAWLFGEFSGVANASGPVCNARIQAVYDLKAMSFVSFSIDSYTTNDLAAAPDLELRPGDLALRDRGYLCLGEMVRHIEAGAFFIYRHKNGSIYRDPKTDRPIDLPAILRRNGKIDREVTLNDKARTRVRIVAAPVSKETADNRRMRAKKEVKGRNPSKAVLEMMAWTVLITNIGEEIPFGTLLDTYGLRWRIEVIFKIWKSHMGLKVVHRASALELRICLSAKLLAITIGTGHLYRLCYERMRERTERDLSMMKFSDYIAGHPERVIRICVWLANGADGSERVCRALRKYCCHDKRKRLNYHQKQRGVS